VGTYQGEVFPVNPFRPNVQGIKAYPSIGKIPSEIDLAIVATPAHTVPQIVEECGKAGVKGIIITSAGFRETGKEGRSLEQQILEHKKTYNLRIIGPNSYGVIRPRINLYATFGKKTAFPGKIAFISQSAALCASALDWAAENQVGLSAVVSTGSRLDVDLGDLIDYFGMDRQTESIVLYVESVINARKFMSAARGFARSKPIVVVKAGRFQESKALTLSHSGNLSGQDAVHEAAFRRVGVVRVEALSDLFNCADALTTQPNPDGPNLTIITNAGGPAIMATDWLIAKGGKLPQLSAESVQGLKRVLPSYCCIANPLDVFEDATHERFRQAMEICLNDPNSSGSLIIFTPHEATDSCTLAQVGVESAKKTKKPLLFALTGEDDRCREARRILQRNGIPAFRTPEEAVSTFMYMWTYTQNLELLYQTPEEAAPDVAVPAFIRGILRRAFCEGRQVLTLTESLKVIEAYKIPTVRTLVAKTAEEATALSWELGFPVVMKALSPQITHKSEIEGVILNICSAEEVPAFFNELAEKVKKSSVAAEFQGVVIQRMVRNKGYEILVGAKKDRQFGATILFGAGGTATEFFQDTSVGFPPLNKVLARRLMENTKIYKHALSRPHPFSSEALEEILVNFSQLVTDFPEIDQIDVNPLIADEKSAVAVDARIVIDAHRIMREGAEHDDHLVIAAYPKKYVAPRKLKNGTQVLLRPIKPEDEGRFNELFKSLSEETMRFRFFEIIKELSHDTLTRYCNLDYDREIAIAAEIQDGSKKIIGAARLIRDPDGKSGEYAVLVGDAWHGIGLGSILMDSLAEVARDWHLERIYGYVIRSNYKMINVCTRKGFKFETLDEDTVKAVLELPSS
jgi:acetyltransferase